MHSMTQRFTRLVTGVRRNGWRTLAIGLMAILSAGIIAACSSSGGDQPKAQKSDTQSQQDSYTRLQAEAPAHEMTNPITRDTINFWIDTWNKPGALAYVYLQNANGDITGYFVLKGLPVSYCTALTPNYTFVKTKNKDSSGNDVYQMVPAPGMDGVYYSGGDCNRYYGKDATTGAYVEFTTGQGINMLLYSQPLPGHPNVPPLGPSQIVNGHLKTQK